MHGFPDIITEIKLTRLRWVEHIHKLNAIEIVNRIMDNKVNGRRKNTRPKDGCTDRAFREKYVKYNLKSYNYFREALSNTFKHDSGSDIVYAGCNKKVRHKLQDTFLTFKRRNYVI